MWYAENKDQDEFDEFFLFLCLSFKDSVITLSDRYLFDALISLNFYCIEKIMKIMYILYLKRCLLGWTWPLCPCLFRSSLERKYIFKLVSQVLPNSICQYSILNVLNIHTFYGFKSWLIVKDEIIYWRCLFHVNDNYIFTSNKQIKEYVSYNILILSSLTKTRESPFLLQPALNVSRWIK